MHFRKYRQSRLLVLTIMGKQMLGRATEIRWAVSSSHGSQCATPVELLALRSKTRGIEMDTDFQHLAFRSAGELRVSQ